MREDENYLATNICCHTISCIKQIGYICDSKATLSSKQALRVM